MRSSVLSISPIVVVKRWTFGIARTIFAYHWMFFWWSTLLICGCLL